MGDLLNDTKRFEAAFFVLKKTAANEAAKIPGVPFYVCSLSSRVVNYKGMLTCPGLLRSFPDLQEDDSEVTLVHSRFSTNSSSAWCGVSWSSASLLWLPTGTSGNAVGSNGQEWRGTVGQQGERRTSSCLVRSSALELRFWCWTADESEDSQKLSSTDNFEFVATQACEFKNSDQILFSDWECFAVLPLKHPSTSPAYWQDLFWTDSFSLGHDPVVHVCRATFLTFVGGPLLSVSLSLSLSLSSFSPPNDLIFSDSLYAITWSNRWFPNWTSARVRHRLQPNVPRPIFSKCHRSTNAHHRFQNDDHSCLKKLICSFAISQWKRTNPHTCEMPRNCTSSREAVRNLLTVRRDFKSHNFLCQHKNRKNMVDCFPAQERRNRTRLRAIHQPFSRTKLLAASCSAAYCADFLVVACLDREILGHTPLHLARPLSEKSSRPQFSILVSSISIDS